MEDDDKETIKLTRKKNKKAKEEETIFEIGDNCPLHYKFNQFPEGTLPKWSKAIHKAT